MDNLVFYLVIKVKYWHEWMAYGVFLGRKSHWRCIFRVHIDVGV